MLQISSATLFFFFFYPSGNTASFYCIFASAELKEASVTATFSSSLQHYIMEYTYLRRSSASELVKRQGESCSVSLEGSEETDLPRQSHNEQASFYFYFMQNLQSNWSIFFLLQKSLTGFLHIHKAHWTRYVSWDSMSRVGVHLLFFENLNYFFHHFDRILFDIIF